ncbi:MAG: host specificity protein J, partial [Opitutus sp.]|nr:host specificity protein J [Opitutus sp.]
TLTSTVAGDPWKIEYRENSPASMWAVDANAAMWTDDASAFWDVPDWQASPGQVTVSGNTIYDFRISTGEAQTQGTVTAFAVVVDAPDVIESINNAVLASGGTRLALTKTYKVIKNISLTIQQDGNGAASIQILDKLKAGPLVRAFNTSGTGVAALIDATIQGY